MRISDWSSDVCSSDLHINAEIGDHFLRGRIDRRRHHAVDVARFQPGIRDCAARGFQHHVHRGSFGTLDECGFAHTGYGGLRSEEHTSELQSLMRISYAVFCLKKKKQNKITL